MVWVARFGTMVLCAAGVWTYRVLPVPPAATHGYLIHWTGDAVVIALRGIGSLLWVPMATGQAVPFVHDPVPWNGRVIAKVGRDRNRYVLVGYQRLLRYDDEGRRVGEMALGVSAIDFEVDSRGFIYAFGPAVQALELSEDELQRWIRELDSRPLKRPRLKVTSPHWVHAMDVGGRILWQALTSQDIGGLGGSIPWTSLRWKDEEGLWVHAGSRVIRLEATSGHVMEAHILETKAGDDVVQVEPVPGGFIGIVGRGFESLRREAKVQSREGRGAATLPTVTPDRWDIVEWDRNGRVVREDLLRPLLHQTGPLMPRALHGRRVLLVGRDVWVVAEIP